MLKQRDEEWKEEIEMRERALMKRLDSKIKTLYNEQLKRDEDVLTFLEKRKGRMEANMLQKAEGLNIFKKNNSRNLESLWRRERRS